ncbi:uncharacterized protein LOC132698258 [Cylas formicarius]|uniref:uncharacterized protein LOC132698258 n=1 Tax=Cylas formicarius TaxID=197179 RepID=UPI0029584BED|nr:uncharacterized protein LOC132698258 [Cylas formicarius]
MACQNSPENTDVPEKSLSPVLSNSRSYRKVLHVKKRKYSNIRNKVKTEENKEPVDETEPEIATYSEKLGPDVSLVHQIEYLKKWKADMEKNYDKIAYSSTLGQNELMLGPAISENDVSAMVIRDLEPAPRIFTKSTIRGNRSVKNIFTDENFDDLKPFKGGFDKIPTAKRNIFENENFDDLKLQGSFVAFQKSSSILRPKQVNSNSDLEAKKCAERQFINGPNIFQNEQLDDIKLPMHFDGFKKCSFLIEKELFSNKETLTIAKNIFENENFKSFQKSTSILPSGANCKLAKEKCTEKQCTKITSDIFPDEQFDDLQLPEDFNGFQKSSFLITKSSPDKRSALLESKLVNSEQTNTKATLPDMFGDENFDDLKLGRRNFGGFIKASEKNKLSTNRMLTVNLELDVASAVKQGSSEAGRVPKISGNSGFRNIFDNEDFDDLKNNEEKIRNNSSSYKNGNFKQLFADENFDDLKHSFENLRGFSKASATTVDNCNDFNRINYCVDEDFKGFTDSEKLISSTVKNAFCKHISFPDTPNTQSKSVNKIQTTDLNVSMKNKSQTHGNVNFLRRPKKRLGVHVSPSITVSDRSLKRAKMLFEDEFSSTSTPVRADVAPKVNCDITPIQKRTNVFSVQKNTPKSESFGKIVVERTLISGRFQIRNPSEVGIDQVLHDIGNERRLLEEKLRIIGQRETALSDQRQFLLFPRENVKANPGFLYVAKSKGHCRRLRTIAWRQNLTDFEADNIVYQINPTNAAMVHFNLNDVDEEQPFIVTADGAKVIPNGGNQIGLPEVDRSFKTMLGVDPGLIPKGWVKNHYKWIVWKLASYERTFPDIFDRCLSVENVVRQLKYRYDREIDKAERPAVRKILEKDDCAQKRLVLCVSKISRVGTGYELELTDGWYAVRTVIDRPLCDQIDRGKLRVGTKIITCGAELSNCEACSPLEVSDLAYLRISYNSTRRAAWWAKLGYQRDPDPFPVSLSSVRPEGGKIGCARFYLARVYPVKYLESVEGKKVWRNEKAEERRTQEWQCERERESAPRTFKHIEKEDIREVRDPGALYEMLQRSDDPEGLQEYLTDSQKESVYSYRAAETVNTHSSDVISRVSRDVTPLLKLRVVDCDDVAKDYTFNVWRPSETHFQILKEEEIVTAFNVTCSKNWGLGSNSHTRFRREGRPTCDDKFDKLKRRVTLIDRLAPGVAFREFDTVGVLVKKRIESNFQDFWLAGPSERLLLVNVYESPRNISLLGSVKDGDVLTVSNLTFQQAYDTYSRACADHYTTVAKYSRCKHLQDACQALNAELEERDFAEFLTLCRKKVVSVEEKWNSSAKLEWGNDDMDSSQLTSTDIALMECMNKFT